MERLCLRGTRFRTGSTANQYTRRCFRACTCSRTDNYGQLTLLGQTHLVRFAAQKFNCYESPMLKTQVCGGDFTATIDRTKWGMNYLVDAGMTKNVTLTLQVEAAKQ